MKNKLKRVISMLILVLLILPMLTFKVNAFEYSDLLNEDTREILKILSIYGLMEGYDRQSFKPGNCVTKAEMAKIAVVLLGYNEFTKGMESNFTDMKGHWAERYVDLVDELDIIKAEDENTYKPNKYLSYSEAITVILKILGYKEKAVADSSAEGYLKLAKELGLLKNVNNPSTEFMTRESLAYLVYNALFTNTVEYRNDRLSFTGETLLNNIGKKVTMKIDDVFALNHAYIDLSAYLLNVCDVYFDSNGKILLVENPLYKTIEGEVTYASSTNIIFLSDKFKNNTTYDLNGVPIVFNGLKSKVTRDDLKNSHLRLVMSDDSETIIGAVAYKATDNAVIDARSLYKDGDMTFAGKILPTFNGKLSLEHVKVIGDANSIYDIQEDDLVYFYETKEDKGVKSTLIINVVRNSIIGDFGWKGKLNYRDFYTINLKNYRLSPDFRMKEELTLDNIGDSMKAILDVNNEIVDAKILRYSKEPENYGIVLDVKNAEINQLPIITIINKKGSVQSFELGEYSGLVSKEFVNRNVKYTAYLNKGDFIKYDLYNESSIKIVKKIDGINIAGDFNSKTGTLSNYGGIIGTSTTIVQISNDRYEKLSRSSLGNYIEGKAVFNQAGTAEMLVLERSYIKTTEPEVQVNPENPTIISPPVKFTGTIYGAIQTIGNDSSSVKLFNYATTYSVDKNLNKDLRNYKNQFVKLIITNNIVTDIVAYSPEISKSKVTAIYNGQLQIDGISYVEYSKNVMVFTCNYDSSGNIASFSEASVNDIKINSTLKFYNISKNYNGVMDIIIIYN